MPKHFIGRAHSSPREVGLGLLETLDAESYLNFLTDKTAVRLSTPASVPAGMAGTENRILEAVHPAGQACSVSWDTARKGWTITTSGPTNNAYGVLHPVIFGEIPLAGLTTSSFWTIGPSALTRYDDNVAVGGLNTWRTTTAATTPPASFLTVGFRFYVPTVSGCEIFCGLYSGPSSKILPAVGAASYVGTAYNGSRGVIVSYNSDVGPDWRTILNNGATAVTAATRTDIPATPGNHSVICRINDRLQASVSLDGRVIPLGTVESNRFWLPFIGIKNVGTAGARSLTVTGMVGLRQ